MPKRSSSVVGREFGNGVRAISARTGLPHRRLAEPLGRQEAKISRNASTCWHCSASRAHIPVSADAWSAFLRLTTSLT
ncbi:hypothetical protein [Lentzea nigeriaca]|uniref:hypothetical protein n=1 Tax=Lentzea nigeriaca TaxID=1128665 RepID=UPI00195CFBBD|nr:hypothetical protein [Lentzea nigeriaca]MBM7858044.1 hypothetical protein [Lentzea nigeriaca]